MPRHHTIITGTGRAGTTFLIQLFTELGLDTGFKDFSDVDPISHAGMEKDIEQADAPYFVKSPWLCDELDNILDTWDIIIDHAIVPMRDLYEAAESRRYITSKSKKAYGGLWHTSDPELQEEALEEQFYALMHTLCKRDIKFTLIHFPGLVLDMDYLWGKILENETCVKNVSFEKFKKAFKKIANPKLIHEF